MHVTTIEEKLQLYLLDAEATWSDADTALWNDGAPRMLVVHRGGSLSAAALVDAQLRRAPGAQLVVAHDGDVTHVARRTAERFGITLLDARALPAPTPPEPAAAPPPAFADVDAALVPAPVIAAAPALFAEVDAAPVLVPAPAPVIVAPPPSAPPATFPLPPYGFFASLERAVVVQAFPLPTTARFFEALERPVVVQEFPLPATARFFDALEQPAVVPDFPVPDAALVRALEHPYEAPSFPTPEEGFFAAFDEALAIAPPAAPHELPFPAEADGLLDALDMTLVMQALESAALETETLTALPEPAAALVAELPLLDAPELALDVPAIAEETPAPAEPAFAPWPAVENVVAPPVEAPAVVEPLVVPWAREAPDALTADLDAGAEDEPSVAVTPDEVAAMPWSIEETRATPRNFMPHPSEVMPSNATWGLPWPRPVAPNDGLRVVDAAKWDARGALAPPQAPAMPTLPPQHANSAWLRRLQSFGGP